MTLTTRLGDWWRGYTGMDVVTLREKCQRAQPGAVISLTTGEHKALCEGADMKRPETATLCAQAGLRATMGALLDDYPKAVKDGRTEAWLKAVIAIAEWYAHIDQHGIDGMKGIERDGPQIRTDG